MAIARWLTVFASAIVFTVATAQETKLPKVVLIAGPKDKTHPAGTHEYEKSVRVLEHCLRQQSGVAVEAHFNGWPKDDSTLRDAATVVLISAGSDRDPGDHPLLIGDRLAVLGKEMQRGCGLVTLHWSTFFPREKASATLLEWTGGHFDYESGSAPRRWASDIQTLTTKLRIAPTSGAMGRGLADFELNDEFYYKIRLKKDDPKFKPVLLADMKNEKEPQVVAWSIERADGGRGFAFTGGHFFRNWWNESFRRVVLNAILWTAKVEAPKEGVASVLPPQEKFNPEQAAVTPAVNPDWTPRPATGKAEPWETFTDKDWVDDRLRRMDTGPFFDATFEYEVDGKKQIVNKGTAIKLDHGRGGVIFDRHQLRIACAWTGGYLKHSDKRFGLLNTPKPDGQILYGTLPGLGWANPEGKWDNPNPATAPLPETWGRFDGLQVHGNQVVLHYRIDDMDVKETFDLQFERDEPLFVRTIHCGPSAREQKLCLNAVNGDWVYSISKSWVVAGPTRASQGVTAIYSGPKENEVRKEITYLVLSVPSSKENRHFAIAVSSTPRYISPLFSTPEGHDIGKLLTPGPRRWGAPLVTEGVRAPDKTAYVIDTLTVPYENRFKALFFITGVDFLPDGRIAVCTCHGDVWLVSTDESLKKVTWQRFATGLYQPLGLKVVDGKIIVHERGQLTRLHDLNGDGEADFFENFCDQWHTGAGEHSYDSCLETDPQGNFYFFKTGDGETPTGGCLLKATKDGRRVEIMSTGFRHPMGLCCSPAGVVTGADQEGNWMPATRVDEYRQGGFYGDMRTHHRAVAPKIYDAPLCWLPREVDNSAGGQVWIPDGQFGPLAGQMLHLSFGRCKAYLIYRQTNGTVSQGGAFDLGLKFLSGSMHSRFNLKDGCLYVTGLTGWQTGAIEDGCLQRVRYTGKPMVLPTKLQVSKQGIDLTFNEPLDPASLKDAKNFDLEQWNYRWSGDYGSKHWSVRKPNVEGHDPVAIEGAELLADGRTVRLKVVDLKPVMQMKLTFAVKAAAGVPCAGVVHLTVNWVE